jgi:hypothetical protein
MINEKSSAERPCEESEDQKQVHLALQAADYFAVGKTDAKFKYYLSAILFTSKINFASVLPTAK